MWYFPDFLIFAPVNGKIHFISLWTNATYISRHNLVDCASITTTWANLSGYYNARQISYILWYTKSQTTGQSSCTVQSRRWNSWPPPLKPSASGSVENRVNSLCQDGCLVYLEFSQQQQSIQYSNQHEFYRRLSQPGPIQISPAQGMSSGVRKWVKNPLLLPLSFH
jgi:hypothetical protein